jgi:hypothetical protein
LILKKFNDKTKMLFSQVDPAEQNTSTSLQSHTKILMKTSKMNGR